MSREPTNSRFAMLLAGYGLGLAVYFSYVNFLSIVWKYYGFTYDAPGEVEWVVFIALIAVGSLAVPKRIDSPGALVVVSMFIVVYIPTVVVTLCLNENRVVEYGWELVAMASAYTVMCAAVKKSSHYDLAGGVTDVAAPGFLGGRLERLLLITWAIGCVILVWVYRSKMRFVGLDEMYSQRAIGSSVGNMMGYVQAYFGKLLSPALIAAGLVYKRKHLVAIGSLGCLVIYMITAEKTMLFMPVALVALYGMLSARSRFFGTTAFASTVVAAMVVFATVVAGAGGFGRNVADIVSMRAMGLPGLTLSQYETVFGTSGYTWWSHVKGIETLVSAPSAYTKDINWPNLGHMVGDRFYHHEETNANANMFASDGVAAAGAFGIVVIGSVASVWLFILNRASRGWDRRFAILAILPVSLLLLNGSLFTVLLSFGGIAWLFVFAYFRPRLSSGHQ